MAESTAEPHSSAIMSSTTSPPVAAIRLSPTMVMTPVCSMAPTTMNRPKKKPMVLHSTPSMAVSRSTRDMSSITPAAPNCRNQRYHGYALAEQALVLDGISLGKRHDRTHVFFRNVQLAPVQEPEYADDHHQHYRSHRRIVADEVEE